jgi:hypothetical protein
LAAAAIQERAAAFEENFEARRRVLRVSPRENQDQKQNQGRDRSKASHTMPPKRRRLLLAHGELKGTTATLSASSSK